MTKLTRYLDLLSQHPFLLLILSTAVAFTVGIAMMTSSGELVMSSVDGHDRLGQGLREQGVLAFHPHSLPTVLRGPLYPTVVAGALVAGDSLFPFLLLLFQSIFHGLTVLCVVEIVNELRRQRRDRRALIAGLIVAFHPLLLMYVGRIMVESLSILLFTAIILAALRVADRSALRDYAILGLLIGLAALTKGIYLTLLLLPLVIFLHRDRHRQERRVVARYGMTYVLALLIIVPWTLRNHYVSGSIVPVQILDGVNFAVGDHLVENWYASPLAYGPIIAGFPYPDFRGTTVDMMAAPAGITVAYDRELRARSLARYRAEPMFLAKKVALQSVTFWGLWSSIYATLLAGGMQIVLLMMFLYTGHRMRRDGGWKDRRLIAFWGVWLYVLPHLPLYAIGRYSVVVIPVMVAVCVGDRRGERV